MADQERSEQESDSGNEASPEPSSSFDQRQNADTSASNAGKNNRSHQHQEPGRFRLLVRGHSLLEWLTLIFDVLTVLILIAYTYYAGQQWQTMGGQLDAMRATIYQTRELVRQARAQSRSASNSADAAIRAADTGQKALDASIRNSRLDQRAWVGVRETNTDGLVLDLEKTTFTIIYVNTGKTPAFAVHAFMAIHRVRSGQKPKPDYSESDAETSSVIVPGTKGLMKKAEVFPRQELSDIRSGVIDLYIYGTIWYSDVFHVKHISQFCSVYDWKEKEMMTCAPGFHDAAN
jgi:hypothetical protein